MSIDLKLSEIVDEAVELLPKINHFIFREDQYRSKGFELSVPQLRLLRVVHEKGEISMGDLSNQLLVAPPSVTMTAERLVQQDLLARKDVKGDRRVVLLYLTAKGKALMKKFIEAKKQRWHEIFSSLHTNDREILVSTLRHLLSILEKTEKRI